MSDSPHSGTVEEEPEGRWRGRLRKWGRELVVNGAIIGMVVLAMVAYQRDVQSGGGGKLPVGKPPPDFSLVSMDHGRKVARDDLVGKPVILNFWATWCGPCVRELPIIQALHDRQGDAFRVMTITTEPASVVRPFLRARDIFIPVLYDPDGRVSAAYGATSIPTTVILDREGRVVHDFSGGAYEDILEDHMRRLSAPSI